MKKHITLFIITTMGILFSSCSGEDSQLTDDGIEPEVELFPVSFKVSDPFTVNITKTLTIENNGNYRPNADWGKVPEEENFCYLYIVYKESGEALKAKRGSLGYNNSTGTFLNGIEDELAIGKYNIVVVGRFTKSGDASRFSFDCNNFVPINFEPEHYDTDQWYVPPVSLQEGYDLFHQSFEYIVTGNPQDSHEINMVSVLSRVAIEFTNLETWEQPLEIEYVTFRVSTWPRFFLKNRKTNIKQPNPVKEFDMAVTDLGKKPFGFNLLNTNGEKIRFSVWYKDPRKIRFADYALPSIEVKERVSYTFKGEAPKYLYNLSGLVIECQLEWKEIKHEFGN